MIYHHTHGLGSGGLKIRGRCKGCDKERKDRGLSSTVVVESLTIQNTASVEDLLQRTADAEVAKSEKELRMLAKIYFPNSSKTDRRKFANIATSLLLQNMLKAVDILNGIAES